MTDNTPDGSTQDEPTHDELVEQAETVLSATRGSLYYPVAHGEAARLQEMIERKVDVEADQDG